MLDLGDLDRGRGHVGRDVRHARETVGIGPPTPCAAGEVDIDERRPVGMVAANRDTGIAAVRSREDTIGHHLGEGAEATIDHAKAGEAARGAGAGQYHIGDGANRRSDTDGAENAVVVGDVGGQHRADGAIGRGLGERERVVDRALDLRVGAGPIRLEAVALLGQRDEQADRLVVVHAIVVDPILETEDAIGQVTQRRPRQPLGVVE